MSLIATDLDPEAETTVRDALSQRFPGARILVQDVQVMASEATKPLKDMKFLKVTFVATFPVAQQKLCTLVYPARNMEIEFPELLQDRQIAQYPGAIA